MMVSTVSLAGMLAAVADGTRPKRSEVRMASVFMFLWVVLVVGGRQKSKVGRCWTSYVGIYCTYTYMIATYLFKVRIFRHFF